MILEQAQNSNKTFFFKSQPPNLHRLSFDQEAIMSRLAKWIFPGGDYLTRADSRYPFRELVCDKIIVTSGALHYNTGGGRGGGGGGFSDNVVDRAENNSSQR